MRGSVEKVFEHHVSLFVSSCSFLSRPRSATGDIVHAKGGRQGSATSDVTSASASPPCRDRETLGPA